MAFLKEICHAALAVRDPSSRVSFKNLWCFLVNFDHFAASFSSAVVCYIYAGRTQSMKSMIDGNRWHSMTIDAN